MFFRSEATRARPLQSLQPRIKNEKEIEKSISPPRPNPSGPQHVRT